jgi:hypothetical protein
MAANGDGWLVDGKAAAERAILPQPGDTFVIAAK